MKNKLFAAVATCLVILAGAAGAEESAAPIPITVDAVAQARFGVTIATLKGAATPSEVATTARVLDPSSLLQLDRDLTVAAASFGASRTEVLRIRKLYSEERSASYRDVQAANVQAEADLQGVHAAHRKLALQWGNGVADMQAHRRADVLNDLTNAHAELARVEIPAGMPIPRLDSTLEVRGDSPAAVFPGWF